MFAAKILGLQWLASAKFKGPVPERPAGGKKTQQFLEKDNSAMLSGFGKSNIIKFFLL